MKLTFNKIPSPNSSGQDSPGQDSPGQDISDQDTSGQDIAFIILLTLLAATLYGFFHFSGFVGPDEVRYAFGFQDWSNEGERLFNYEMSFGYYLVLKPIISLLPIDFIPFFLNIISSLAGTLLLIPLYRLIKALSNSRIALATGLFLIFSPPYWLLTRYGHPMPIALFFSFGSMAVFNRALDTQSPKKGMWLGLSILLSLCALLIRADTLLSFLVPLGIVLYKEDKFKKSWPFLLSFYGLTLLGYLVLKWWILGYIVNPIGGTVVYHLENQIPNLSFVIKSLTKNMALFFVGFLPLLTICFFIALWKLFRNKEWRFLIFIGLWTLPIAIFLPFWGMDFSRLCVPILPPLLFTLVRWLDNVSWIRYKYVSFLVVLIASHLTLTLTTPLLIKFYPFKTFYQNRPITLVPIEPIFSDYFLRRDYLEEQQRMVRQVIQRTDRNVVIISDGHHFPWYEYELLIRRKALCSPASVTMKDSDWLTCSTGQNTFYAQVIEWQSSTETVNNLILLLKKDFQGCLFHINSFMASMLPNRLFLDKSELVSVLEKNPALINQYREIFQVPAPIKNQSSKEKNGQKN